MTNLEPLAVIINPPPSSVLQIYSGQTSVLSIVVNNQDTQGMVVEVYLDIPEPLRPWCNVSRTSFNLDGGTSQSVEFTWQIPTEAIADRYRYDLVIVSPSSLEPLVYTLELEVLTQTIYQINFQIQTIRAKIKRNPALYQIVSINQGNTIREIEFKFRTGNEEGICQYQIDPSRLKIPPGKTIAVGLKVTPTKRAGRPYWGSPKPINFQLDVKDIHQLPLPSYLPLKGLLLWEPRPIWQILLLILSGVITVSGLGFLIWWLFLKPPILPEIESLEPTRNSYRFGEEIQVKWNIKNSKRLKKIILLAKNAQGEPVIEPLTFTREDLQKNSQCQFTTSPQENLTCQNILTGAKEPNSYSFSLTIWAKKRWNVEEVAKRDTRTIALAPPPTPTITNVGSSKNKYILPEKVDFQFSISHAEELARVDLMKNAGVFASITPTELSKICQKAEENRLNCYTEVPKLEAGSYKFSVEAVPKNYRYVKPQGAVYSKTEVIVEERKIPLTLKKFTLNNKATSPLQLKSNQNLEASWDVTGKNPEVSITVNGTLVAEKLPAKGKHLILYEQLLINGVPTNKVLPVELMVTDADGATKTKQLLVKVN